LSLSHTKWDCKYHIIWIPKYRKKAIFEDLRKYLGEIFRELALQKECKVIEGHLMLDHVHICFPFHPSIRCPRLLAISKEKVRFKLLGIFRDERRILLGSTFGPEDIMYRRLARMRKPCENIYKGREKKINVLSN